MTFDQTKVETYRVQMATLDPQGVPFAQIIYKPHESGDLKPTRIGILDASYNPLTLAHEALIEDTRNTFALDETVMMLSRANVDKEVFGADLGQRLAMLVYYAKQKKYLHVVGCSHARFVDKIQAIKPHYPTHTTFYFIVGFDTLIRLFDPKYYADMEKDLHALFSSAHIVAANRNDHDAGDLHTFLQHPDRAKFANHIHPLTLPPTIANMSSTQVRQHIGQQKPIDHLVPNSIAQAIKTLGIYQNSTP